MQDDRETCRREAEEERAEQRAKLFLPVGEKVGGFVINEEDVQGSQLVEEIESLCMNCGENGNTRLLLTKIPYFREIILISFFCEHCYFKNTEVQSAGEIQEKGAKYMLKMDTLPDMERQIVKSDSAIFRVEELDLEIPAGRGRLTNVEGILAEILRDLEDSQKRRKREYPDLYEKVDAVVQLLLKYMMGQKFPYTIVLDDPAGNAWIEPSPLDSGGKYTKTEYARSPEQNEALGLGNGEAEPEVENLDERKALLGTTGDVVAAKVEAGYLEGVDIVEGQMYSLPCHCPGCAKNAVMNITMVKIPYFKEVILSAIVCPHCGYRTSDVKTGGEFPEKGQRIWLDVENTTDLSRDILKSETCCLKIPACSVEVQPGTMGGRFTTVEGLLTQVRDDLRGAIFDTDDVDNAGGDSMPSEQKKAWDAFFDKINSAIRGEMKYTILMEDPLANSYVQSFTAPKPDPQIRTEEYTRSQEEEEELGLTDMRTHLDSEGHYVKELQGQHDESVVSDTLEHIEMLPASTNQSVMEGNDIESFSVPASSGNQEKLAESEGERTQVELGARVFPTPDTNAAGIHVTDVGSQGILSKPEDDARTHSATDAEASLIPVSNAIDNNAPEVAVQNTSSKNDGERTHAVIGPQEETLPMTENERRHAVTKAEEPLISIMDALDHDAIHPRMASRILDDGATYPLSPTDSLI